jgi:glycosyltransferase involved in cell wall biosynthesis
MKTNAQTVLIVTYYWPPAGGSGVQRWLYFANELKQLGWNPVIVTQQNAAYPLRDKSLEDKIDKSIEVHRVRGWEPFKMAQIGSANTQQDALTQKGFWGAFKRWVRAECFFPDARMFWIAPVVRFIQKYSNEHQIDALITTGPPHSSHMIGYRLTKKLNIPWLADFRDPWADFFQNKQLSMSKRMQKKHLYWQNIVLKNADLVTVTSPSLNQKFKLTNTNCKLLTNGYESLLKGKQSESFSIVYAGVMKAIQNPTNLWKVLGELIQENSKFATDFSLHLIGDFDASVSHNIQSEGLQAHTAFYEYMPKDNLEPYVTSAQMLLMVSVNDEDSYQIIPGKLFEYMAACRTILAIGNPDGDMASLMNKTKTGHVFDYSDKNHLKEYITAAYDRFQRGEYQTISNASIAPYKRSELAKQLSGFLTEMIS